MSSNIKLAYAASSALTITLASLATDANLLAGRQSTAVTNSSNLYLDYLIGGKITTGTSPTVGKSIEVWVYGAEDDTPTYPDAITGTDGNASMSSRDILATGLRLGAFIPTDATSNRAYWIAPFSIAALFGGVLPPAFGIFVVHNTAVNLHATSGNHFLKQTGVYNTIS